MKVKYGKLVASSYALSNLSKSTVGKGGIPIPIFLKIREFVVRVEAALKHYEEARVSLIKRLGWELEDGSFSMENASIKDKKEFDEEFKELLEQELDLPDVRLKVDQLAGGNMSIADLINLDYMIEFDKEQ